jgi:hypothetical protein
LDFMAQNVGIADFGRSACIPLIIRKLDDLYRIECRKYLFFIIFIPIATNRNLLITNDLHTRL